MSRRCDLTGKSSQKAANRSHAKNKTLRRQNVNVQKKSFFIPELRKSVSMMLSGAAIRNITKHGGISKAILKAKEDALSPALKKIRRQIAK